MNTSSKAAIILLIALVIAAGAAAWWTYQSAAPVTADWASPPPVTKPSGPPNRSKTAKPPKPKPAARHPDETEIFADQLANDDTRQAALQQISMMAAERPDAVADGIPVWVTPLLNACQWDDVLNLTSMVILNRPQNTSALADVQRARTVALLRKGNYEQALVAAKSYYNVVPLKETSRAVDLLVDTLDAARAGANPTIVTRFKMQQVAGAQPRNAPASGSTTQPDGNILTTIPSNPSPYLQAVANVEEPNSYDALIGRGNLMLLADRPGEAIGCFKAAWKYTGTSDPKRRAILDGLARAIRARSGAIAPANAFILALRQGMTPADRTVIPEADPDQIARLAQGVPLAVLPPVYSVPLIEQRREEHELDPAGAKTDPQLLTGFECSTPIAVRKLSPTHFDVQITTQGLRDWFMFRLTGAAGKTIRIDLDGDYMDVAGKWSTLNPVYTDAENLDAPETYTCAAGRDAAKPAFNGPVLPPTDGQQWHFISDAWREGRRTLSFVRRYDADSVYIAMRVPYLPSYNEMYLRGLASNPLAKVIEVGRSGQQRPLLLVRLGAGGDADLRHKPCILLYAREHADEHDTSWVTQGAIDYLLSDRPQARELLDRFTFLVIPVLDPDSAVASQHEVIMTTFLPGRTTPESLAYARWFKAWVDRGNRLDLIFDFHNVQSSEYPQVACPMIEGVAGRGRASAVMNAMLMKNLRQARLTVQPKPWTLGLTPDRLGGWLSVTYGPLTLGYELNSQAPDRHLNLSDLRGIGKIVADSVGQFFSTPDATAALAAVDAHRQARLGRWSRLTKAGLPNMDNAIEAEALCSPRLGGGHDIASGELLRP